MFSAQMPAFGFIGGEEPGHSSDIPINPKLLVFDTIFGEDLVAEC
jgi:hypothetical protein